MSSIYSYLNPAPLQRNTVQSNDRAFHSASVGQANPVFSTTFHESNSSTQGTNLGSFTASSYSPLRSFDSHQMTPSPTTGSRLYLQPTGNTPSPTSSDTPSPTSSDTPSPTNSDTPHGTLPATTRASAKNLEQYAITLSRTFHLSAEYQMELITDPGQRFLFQVANNFAVRTAIERLQPADSAVPITRSLEVRVLRLAYADL
ncbi:hypothetical protein GGU10DRAFT_381358 [Lentinula aff. detonsa]|uniref:Uncharacterized protein n=1 Tax=Lentinula aff. detonsa TaxID=2804958 RepID=A0AA38L1M2_9AGAR|nr:hypothetical protein GGU10DRAFT_381358 [Lentinula aff. detonsa]